MSENLPISFPHNSEALQFLIAKKYRLFRHALLIGLMSLILYNSSPELAVPALNLLLFLCLFYTNMYWLVPRFLFKGRYAAYVLSIAGVLGLVILSAKIYLRYFSDSSTDDDGLNIPLFAILILILIAASSSIKLFQKWMYDQQRIFELEQSKTTVELEQLKNQINPHFLFNMLNNANVLTKKDPDKASEVLMKLSDLLRYQLYDSARDQVLLTSDIHFLEDFLNLEKVRRDQFDFVISKEGNINGVLVPPLLFISFVENAVKHNNDATKGSYVELFFEVNDHQLFFKCINSKPLLKAVHHSGGLGLANIKRRLELLFPSSHELTIEDHADMFYVSLTINLAK